MTDISLPKIRDAHQRIRQYLPSSAIKESVYLHKRCGVKTILKLENLNLSGSFKIRGAVNALTRLSASELANGVIAASAGNHAQGVAYGARLLNAKATIFMPERAPLIKVESTRDLGAEVILSGSNYDEAFLAAQKYHSTNQGVMVHGFADAHVINGQGTIGIELLEQIQNLGMVIASIGGGGLMAGLLTSIKALDPSIIVIGVQSSAFPAMKESYKDKKLRSTTNGSTIADGIAVKCPSQITFNIIQQLIDDIVVVDEESIASAIMNLMEWDHTLAEGAGAAPIAALLSLPHELLNSLGSRSVACVVSGGNIDVNLLRRVIPSGLKSAGRLTRIKVRIADRPGRLAELLNLVGKTGANLQEVQHNRLFGIVGYEDVEVVLDLETLNNEHKSVVIKAIEQGNFKISGFD